MILANDIQQIQGAYLCSGLKNVDESVCPQKENVSTQGNFV